jgi:hypothetical protein
LPLVVVGRWQRYEWQIALLPWAAGRCSHDGMAWGAGQHPSRLARRHVDVTTRGGGQHHSHPATARCARRFVWPTVRRARRLIFSRRPPPDRPTTTWRAAMSCAARLRGPEQTGGGKRLKGEVVGGGGAAMEGIGGAKHSRTGVGWLAARVSTVEARFYNTAVKK